MHVLQYAQRVIRHVDAEIFLDLGVPGLGQVLDLQRAVDQRRLDVGAQHHMEIIGQLIRLDPDEAGTAAVDGAVEFLCRHVAELLGIKRLSGGEVDVPEGPGAADMVFPEP